MYLVVAATFLEFIVEGVEECCLANPSWAPNSNDAQVAVVEKFPEILQHRVQAKGLYPWSLLDQVWQRLVSKYLKLVPFLD